MDVMKLILGFEQAKAFLSRNRALAAQEVSPELLDALTQAFGEALTPEEAVRRIITQVRAGGDAALRYWSERLDGVRLSQFAIGADEIETAYEETPLQVRQALE